MVTYLAIALQARVVALVLRLPTPVRRLAHGVVDALPSPFQDKVNHLVLPAIRRLAGGPAAVSPLDNVGYNTEIWDQYAKDWSDPAYRQEQLGHEGRAGENSADVVRLGEEWGRLDDAVQAIDEWILPHVTSTSVCGEIGTGGGRVAVRVAPKVAEFHCFDVSANMLKLVEAELREVRGARFHHLPTPVFPAHLAGRFDFLYSFDVFVHLDLHVQWRYLQAIAAALKPSGKGFLHTANLTAPTGWERFADQGQYRVEGFYFMTPEAVRTLIERAGLRVVSELSGQPGNFYYERDYFVLFEKPST